MRGTSQRNIPHAWTNPSFTVGALLGFAFPINARALTVARAVATHAKLPMQGQALKFAAVLLLLLLVIVALDFVACHPEQG
jgi:hypothetical protein